MHPIYNYIIFCTCLGTLGQFKGLLLFSHFALMHSAAAQLGLHAKCSLKIRHHKIQYLFLIPPY